MAFSILYKRLVSVNLLHEYYLNNGDTEFFELDEEQKRRVLNPLLLQRRYPVADEIMFVPTPETAVFLRGHKMLVKQTPLGITIGMAVEQVVNEGVVRYKPLVAPALSARLQFAVQIKRPDVPSFSNIRLNPVFPACFYFTNDNTTFGKVFPSLSVPIQSYQPGITFEMGEQAVIGGTPMQAIRRASNKATENWISIVDHRTVNEYDRIVVSAAFRYRFSSVNVTKATFQLQREGELLKTIKIENEKAFTDAWLDLEKLDDGRRTPDGFYTLSVQTGDEAAVQYTIYLSRRLYDPTVFGILDLVLLSGDAAFSLLDADGMLVTVGNNTHPQFELRFRSRKTYWQYFFQNAAPEGADDDWEVVDPTPSGVLKVIVSKKPFSLTNRYRSVGFQTNRDGFVPLPNPESRRISLNDDKYCSDVLLTKIKL